MCDKDYAKPWGCNGEQNRIKTGTQRSRMVSGFFFFFFLKRRGRDENSQLIQRDVKFEAKSNRQK